MLRTTYFFLCCLIGINLSAQTYTISYQEKILQHREKTRLEFLDSTTSPLKQEDWISFKELNYYSIDSTFRVIAKFRKDEGEVFKMKTSTTRLPLYKVYGVVTFSLQGKSFSIPIYQNQDLKSNEGYEDYLFLPFTDNTSGDETYGGGRYLDLRIPETEDLIIDFNLAYNPYCAYNHKYSCPIPPQENYIDFSITAGEKKFKED